MTACGLLIWSITACKGPITPEPDAPKNDTTAVTPQDTTVAPPDTVPVPPVPPARPESFPKKHLLEEFTGQDCGYCPYGMNCVHDFVANDTNWIVVLHHYGYSADHFSVAGSKLITNKLSLNGAPNITINRATTKTEDGRAIYFHPGYLPTTDKSQFATTTYASLCIDNTYDEASRLLKVHLSGMTCKDDHPQLMLTLLVKESGMVDYQQDYYYTYEGWKEFRHTNAVRAFLTAPLGDSVRVDSTWQWTADYELTLSSNWLPENCAVVALLSEEFKPVVQAEQRPVVSGTQGGADIKHGGITPVPVADYYPEPGASISPETYSHAEADTLNVAQAQYTPYPEYGFNYWQIMAYNTSVSVKVNNTTCIPFAYIYLFTSLSDKSIPTGTYELNTSMEPNTAYAGFRDDENIQIGGSSFYYTNKSYFQQGYLVPPAQWLIADGTMTVTEDGWTLVGHARNGSDINLFGSTAIKNYGRASGAPRRVNSCNESIVPFASQTGDFNLPIFEKTGDKWQK